MRDALATVVEEELTKNWVDEGRLGSYHVSRSPESEFIYHEKRFAAQFKAIVLLILWFIALKYPFQQPDVPTLQPASGE